MKNQHICCTKFGILQWQQMAAQKKLIQLKSLPCSSTHNRSFQGWSLQAINCTGTAQLHHCFALHVLNSIWVNNNQPLLLNF